MAAKTSGKDPYMKSEVRDGMAIDWDVPITMDDGLVVRADVFRPLKPGKYPALLSYGPYGKGLHFEDGYKTAWDIMVRDYPDTAAGSTNKYQNWEVVDPEKWVPHDYICIRVDSRGAGRTPGKLDHHSMRETRDLHDCIEWAAMQDWSNGKVGLAGISYYATNQWRVAGLKPPHLAAICVWEGYADRYRDSTHHGGIVTTFQKNWQVMQIKTVQHGLGERGPRSRVTGELVCGPETIPEKDMPAIANIGDELIAHPLDDAYYKDKSAVFENIEVPLLSCGNWGGQGLHLRGNVEGFVRSASKEKWLELHGGSHWAIFYTDYANALQRRFFDYYLKGKKNDWPTQPKVQLNVRHPGEKFVIRHENEWPIARTQWTKFYPDADTMSFGTSEPKKAGTKAFQALGEGLTFRTRPLEKETEITGPLAAKLYVSTSTTDCDLFLVFRVFDDKGKEVLFQGALDPAAPVGQGWLRASHRKLDRKLSTEYRPFHTHDELLPVKPGEIYELDVEIWPTCIVVPKGYTLAFSVLGRDYENGLPPGKLSNMRNPMKGCGPFVHDDPDDRPASVFGGTTTLHFAPGKMPYVLVPIIPAKT